jgi:hypothetical protein
MHRSNFTKGDNLLHTIDFSTLKKPTVSLLCKLESSSLEIINHPNSALLLLGIFAIMNETV